MSQLPSSHRNVAEGEWNLTLGPRPCPSTSVCQFSVPVLGVGDSGIVLVCGGLGPLPSYDMARRRGTGKTQRIWSQMRIFISSDLYHCTWSGLGVENSLSRKINLFGFRTHPDSSCRQEGWVFRPPPRSSLLLAVCP